MIKTTFLFLITISLLPAEPIKLELPKDPLINIQETEDNRFGYIAFSGCGFIVPISPELAIGWRKLNSKHCWDIQAGTSLVVGQYFWGQGSYLHYFIPPKGSYSAPYLGVGLTIGHVSENDYIQRSSAYANLPITVGYQWGEKGNHQFFQIQFTPLVITTLSYGIGF